jgi:hypothetical protein
MLLLATLLGSTATASPTVIDGAQIAAMARCSTPDAARFQWDFEPLGKRGRCWHYVSSRFDLYSESIWMI